MSATAAALVKAAILALTDENTRKKIGWVLAAILSPVILLIAFLCALGSGTASHNLSVVELCFYGGKVPSETPDEYRAYIEEMRAGFNLLDGSIENINELTEGEDGLDEIRVKALFYALYFGTDSPSQQDCQKFVSCFVTYEERTRTVTVEHEDGTITEEEETYTVAVSIEDLEVIYQNIRSTMGVEATEDQRSNAESIYSLIRYGYTGGSSFEGADVPFIGADGFCSPIGENWRSVVTSEFGNRIDPITGQRRGHTGMDLAVPTGTPIRAALPGMRDILNARLERAADFIVHQGTEATENGSWSISFKELEKQTEITVRRGNGLDGMLLEALTHRREVTSAALTDTGIDTAYHLNFCSRIPGQKPCYFTKLPEEQKTQLFYEAVETLLDFFGDENLYGVLHNGLQMPNEEILARGYLTTEAMLAAGTVMSLPENSGISLRDVLQYELTEDLSLVHAQGGEPVPLEQEEELTRTERKRFSDVLDAHVLESRAGEHGTELVIGGVKPERLERFRSILDAYKPEDQSMETIQ